MDLTLKKTTLHLTGYKQPRTRKNINRVEIMFRGSQPIKAPLPTRKGAKYSTLFNGKNISDKGKLGNINTLNEYLSLWKGACTKPSMTIPGLPFIWEENGVQYSSNSLAFDKNMWVASSAASHWNALVGMSVQNKSIVTKHVKPALLALNYLLVRKILFIFLFLNSIFLIINFFCLG